MNGAVLALDSGVARRQHVRVMMKYNYSRGLAPLQNNRQEFSARVLPLIAVVVYTVNASTAIAQTFESLHWFQNSDGGYPLAGLVQTSDGAFYGTTSEGGQIGYGTVFKVAANGVFTSVVSFNGSNGRNPTSKLVQGGDGNFYGTTSAGGANNAGTVFKVTPDGALTTLVTFDGSNGRQPSAGLLKGSDGNFYGTTKGDFSSNHGTVFKLTANGVLTTLVSFDSSNGSAPTAGLIQTSDGKIYGTTYEGGANGYGTVFRITTSGVLTTLLSFAGTNGANPYAELFQAHDDYLYGTTYYGGTYDNGTVFRISTNGTLTTLFHFYPAIGSYPLGGVVQASDGNFYGTTGSGPNGFATGTIFKMTPSGTLTILKSFSFGDPNGWLPYSSVIAGTDGNLYGTTYRGGYNGYGTVFRLVMPPPIVFHLVRQPQSQLGYWGKSVSFSVSATNGTPPYAYQWQKDSIAIPGATNSVLVLANLQATNAGIYAVVVSDTVTNLASQAATLTVNPAGMGIALYAGVTIEGVVGQIYGVQSTTDLSNTNSWAGRTNLTLTVPTQLWYDSQPASQAQRYYRVVPGPISIP